MKNTSSVCESCGRKCNGYMKRKVDLRELYEAAIANLGEYDSFGTIKGVMGMTSETKIPERLEKGILRVKHGVFVFKDGTARFDATDLPITHFRPAEIGVSVEKLRELGYERDYKGAELKNENQIVELKPQDVILPKNGAEYLLKVANFIDDLLVKFYKMDPFTTLKALKTL